MCSKQDRLQVAREDKGVKKLVFAIGDQIFWHFIPKQVIIR